MIYKLTIDAFTATPETAKVLEQVKEDRDLAKSRVTIRDGGIDAAVRRYAEAATPQVVIIEETGDEAQLNEGLARLAEVCEAGTKVIVIGRPNDISLYRTLMSQGLSEYLNTPVAPRQVLETLRTIFVDPSAAPRGKLVVFFGSRGGVGSSTLAQNLAWHIAETVGDDIIYADFDLSFGTSSLAFNVEGKQTVIDALIQPERVDPVLLERFLVRYGDHLQILMAAGDLRSQLAYQVEAVEKVLEVARQMAPVVVVDVPHLWAPWTEYLLRSADDLVITAFPDLANLRDCKNLMEQVAAKRTDLPTRLVLNRVDAYKKTQLSARDFEETLGFVPVAAIPFEPNLFGTSANNGQMLAETAKSHKVVDTLKQLAAQICGRGAGTAKKKPAAPMMDWLKTGLSAKKRR